MRNFPPIHRLLRQSGFTLIELMLVVSILGILAAIAIPQFSKTIVTAEESSTKGNLGAIRSALSIYYSDTEGTLPSDINALAVNQKYISSIPDAALPAHS